MIAIAPLRVLGGLAPRCWLRVSQEKNIAWDAYTFSSMIDVCKVLLFGIVI
jgi:hypothetical protein